MHDARMAYDDQNQAPGKKASPGAIIRGASSLPTLPFYSVSPLQPTFSTLFHPDAGGGRRRRCRWMSVLQRDNPDIGAFFPHVRATLGLRLQDHATETAETIFSTERLPTTSPLYLPRPFRLSLPYHMTLKLRENLRSGYHQDGVRRGHDLKCSDGHLIPIDRFISCSY